MPLDLFPDWLAQFSRATPFGAGFYIPIQIFLGTVENQAVVSSLGLQLFWIVVLVILDHMILSQGIRKLVIQGG
jgi:ABC-2 type transport system permease protein